MDRRRIFVYGDCSDPRWIVVYRWYRRDVDRYIEDAHELVGFLTDVMQVAADSQHREATGRLHYAYVPTLADLPAHVRRDVRRHRRHLEPRPWRWSQICLVKAWQQTAPRPSYAVG